MNMKDFFSVKLLKTVEDTPINEYMDKFENRFIRPKLEKIELPFAAADFDYKSPIEITKVMDDIGMKQAAALDNATLQAVLKVGVNVDKDELIKALAYDRNQYTKGFNDGLKRNSANWVGIDEFPHEHYECNRCGYEHITDDISIFKYCPNCGALMMGQEAAEAED